MVDVGLEINVRADLQVVVARWQREISPAELQGGYEAILAAADASGYWRWLLDLRRRNELATPEIDNWMTGVFFPQLAQRYEQPVRLAFLVSPLRAQQVGSTTPVLPSLGSHANRPHYHDIFTDEAAAYRWMASQLT
jgi:hypothetical protein